MTGFASHGGDPFDTAHSSDRPFPQRAQPFETRRHSCLACHYPPGVQGLKTLEPMRAVGESAEEAPRPRYPLVAARVDEVERAVVAWKEDRPGWKALRAMLPPDKGGD